MKKSIRTLLILSLSISLFICCTSISCAKSHYFKMTECGNSYYTVTWNYSSNSFKESGEKNYGWSIKTSSGKIIKKTSSPSTRSFKVTGKSKGYISNISLYYRYKENGKVKSRYVKTCNVNTKPKKITEKNLGLSGFNNNILSFKVNKPADTDGFQLKIINKATGKTVLNETKIKYPSTFKVKDNTLYQYKARPFYENLSTGKKYYGDWTVKYFENPKFTLSNISDANGCKLTIPGVKGISKYKVYVSSKDGNKGDLTKTLKIDPGKKKTYTIDNIGDRKMKKGVKYFVRVEAIITATNKSSPIYGFNSFKNTID